MQTILDHVRDDLDRCDDAPFGMQANSAFIRLLLKRRMMRFRRKQLVQNPLHMFNAICSNHEEAVQCNASNLVFFRTCFLRITDSRR